MKTKNIKFIVLLGLLCLSLLQEADNINSSENKPKDNDEAAEKPKDNNQGNNASLEVNKIPKTESENTGKISDHQDAPANNQQPDKKQDKNENDTDHKNNEPNNDQNKNEKTSDIPIQNDQNKPPQTEETHKKPDNIEDTKIEPQVNIYSKEPEQYQEIEESYPVNTEGINYNVSASGEKSTLKKIDEDEYYASTHKNGPLISKQDMKNQSLCRNGMRK